MSCERCAIFAICHDTRCGRCYGKRSSFFSLSKTKKAKDIHTEKLSARRTDLLDDLSQGKALTQGHRETIRVILAKTPFSS
jgi:hypothetical protein